MMQCARRIYSAFTWHERFPCVLLARRAVDRESQQRGIGSLLLRVAIEKILQTSRVVFGAFALIVDAKNDRARDFYEKYGFLRLPEQPYTCFCPFPN